MKKYCPKVAKKLYILPLIALFFVSQILAPVKAVTSDTVNFQGKIVRNDTGHEGLNVVPGTPACVSVTPGSDTCRFQVSYYTAPTGGILLLSETFSNVQIGQYGGVFDISLGTGSVVTPVQKRCGVGKNSDCTTMYQVVSEYDDLYIELKFAPNGVTLSETFSRMPLEASAYSIFSKYARGANDAFELSTQKGYRAQSAATAGMIYYDTTDSEVKVYDGSAWKGVGGSLWTDAGTFTYLTSTTDTLVLGGSTVNDATFVFDVTGASGRYFSVDNADNSSRLFTILSNGNVGIGVSNPTAKLEVEGSSSTISNTIGDLTISTGGGDGDILLAPQGTGRVGILDFTGNYFTFLRGGTQTGNISYTLPTSSTNGVLTNSSGVLSWATASGSSLPSGTLMGQTVYWDGSTWAYSSNLFNNNTNVGIGTISPATKLHITGDGGILAEGTYGSGWDGGTLGAGVRLMWIPNKVAFRAGRVSSTQWDAVNIGDYSVAMGNITTASGLASIAMGSVTKATGGYSTAMGHYTTASGEKSIAVGYYAISSGWTSTAMGALTGASGSVSTAMGYGTIASGDYSTAMGTSTTAQAYASTVLGQYNVTSASYDPVNWIASDPVFAIGIGVDGSNRANAMTVLKGGNIGIGTTSPAAKLHIAGDGGILAEGTYGTGWDGGTLGAGTRLMWIPSKAAFRAGDVSNDQWDADNIGDYSIAMGSNTTASGIGSTAIGDYAYASGSYSTAIGANTSAGGNYSTAMGYFTSAYGYYSTAMGYYTSAQAFASTVLGRYNVVSAGYKSTSWDPDDPIFVIGIGTNASNRANAMTVLKGGNVGIGATSPSSLFSVGSSSQFQVDSSGNLVKVNNVTYSWPSSNSSGVLTNNGSGTLSWAALPSGSLWTQATGYTYLTSTTDNVVIGSSTSSPARLSVNTTTYPTMELKYNNSKVVDIYSNSSSNIFIGLESGNSISSGSRDVGYGYQALRSNTTGSNNVAIGYQPLYSNTTGSNNIAIGNMALYSNTSGIENVGIGELALYSNRAKRGSTAIGYYAMYYAHNISTGTTYTYNTAIGYQALRGSTSAASNSGTYNTVLGANAGYSMTSGYNNTLVGYNVGSNLTSGGNNILIGAGITATAATTSNQLNIGGAIYGTLSNGYVGIGAVSPSSLFSVGSSSQFQVNSSGNLVRINSVTYSWPSSNSSGVLTNNGSGTLSWAASSGGGSSLWTQAGSNIYYNGGNVGIGINSPATRLHVANDGGILAQGTLDSGWDGGTLGSGTRLMWIPNKAAFRAGYVGSIQWDATNIGTYSVAMGAQTVASGNNSIAMGFQTSGSGTTSTAIGGFTIASGEGSTAMGMGSTASGINSTAMGNYTTASGTVSTAMGIGTTASGEGSTAMGYYTTAEAYASTVLGRYNVISGSTNSWVATDPIFAIGIGANASNRANAMTVLKNGNVGIGATNPSSLFSVGSSSQFQVNSSGNLVRINNATYSWPSSNSSGVLTNNGSGTLSWSASSGGGSSLWTQATGYAYLTSTTDNVVIGSSTSSSARLSVNTTTYPTIELKYNNSKVVDIYSNDSSNIFIGLNSGSSIYTGISNTALGSQTLSSNTMGAHNLAVGSNALQSNTNGGGNVGLGSNALYSNTTGHSNVAIGQATSLHNTTGGYNVAIGASALYSNTTGGYNVAIGYQSLDSNSANQGSTAIGYQAMYYADNTSTGTAYTHNTALGYQTLRGSTTAGNNIGTHNTALGSQALYSNTIGIYNVASGYQALYSNTRGSYNLASGPGALYSNDSGNYNIAIGFNTLYSNTEGYYNFASGYRALYSNITGSGNVAIGASALQSNTAGGYNIAIGDSALNSNTTGATNIGIGDAALHSNTSGVFNVAVGASALQSNSAKRGSTAIGYQAMMYAHNISTGTTITYNTALGYQALRGSTNAGNNTGTYNTALGSRTLFSNTSGSENVASGHLALYSNTSGARNVASGFSALFNSQTGDDNIAIGYQTLYSNTSGGYNVAIGSQALYSNTGQSFNTAIGYRALYSSNIGTQNTALGSQAGISITTATNNTLLGYYAGSNLTTGSSNIIIGSGVAASTATTTNQLNIGNAIYGTLNNGYIGIGTSTPSAPLHVNGNLYVESANGRVWGINNLASGHTVYFQYGGDANNRIENTYGSYVTFKTYHGLLFTNNSGTIARFGTSSSSVDSYFSGNLGVGLTAPSFRVDLPNTANNAGRGRANQWSTYSDISLKENIATMQDPLDKILALNPVSFTWRGTSVQDTGLIAQWTESIIPEIVSTADDGIKSIDYSKLTPYLAGAVQQLNTKIVALEDSKVDSSQDVSLISEPGWYRVAKTDSYEGTNVKISNISVGSSQNLNMYVDRGNVTVISNFVSSDRNFTKVRVNSVGTTIYLETYIEEVNNQSVKVKVDSDRWSVVKPSKVEDIYTGKIYSLNGIQFGVGDMFGVASSTGSILAGGVYSDVGDSSNRWNDIYAKGAIRLGSGGDQEGVIRFNTEKKVLEMSNDGGSTWLPVGDQLSKLVLSPEYAGAVLYAEGDNSYGRMTSDAQRVGDTYTNYYQWVSDRETLQSYDILVRVTLPSDFRSWRENAVSLDFVTENSASIENNSVSLSLVSKEGVDVEVSDGVSKLPGVWERIVIKGSDINHCSSAGDTCTLRISLSSALEYYTRVGDIVLNYNRSL